ncbi:conserved protein of unknown function [Hyphomicrobium sp. MC1]|nr:conserved protein of unknown function [Hyphomicrobium sp. MC1]
MQTFIQQPNSDSSLARTSLGQDSQKSVLQIHTIVFSEQPNVGLSAPGFETLPLKCRRCRGTGVSNQRGSSLCCADWYWGCAPSWPQAPQV